MDLYQGAHNVISFFLCLILLIGGYFVYGKFVDRTFAPDDRETPAVEKEDGVDWIVDECFVSYYCTHQDKEFLMITYEKLYSNGENKKSENLIFLPPLGIRFFDLDTLAPYAVKADQMLIYDIHMLWLSILEQYRKNSQSANITVSQR